MARVAYDLVIFDCDGVLVDSERLTNRLESAYFSSLGMDVDQARARLLFKGKTVAEVATLIEAMAERELPSDWCYEWAMTTANGFVRDLKEVQGVSRVLQALVPTVQVCVASQSPLARVELSLFVSGLAQFFEGRIYTASMVSRGKPAPDLFLFAAKQLGAAPEKCAVVEDSESGVLSARAAGMTVFGYAADEDRKLLSSAGAITFDSMAKLPRLLRDEPLPL